MTFLGSELSDAAEHPVPLSNPQILSGSRTSLFAWNAVKSIAVVDQFDFARRNPLKYQLVADEFGNRNDSIDLLPIFELPKWVFPDGKGDSSGCCNLGLLAKKPQQHHHPKRSRIMSMNDGGLKLPDKLS